MSGLQVKKAKTTPTPTTVDHAEPSAIIATDDISRLQEQVRCVASQNVPNESLLLLLLDQLARKAASTKDKMMHTYEEMYRQAKVNQGKISIPAFCLEVLGGGALDVVSKALSKHTFKQKNSDEEGETKKPKPPRPNSPLENLYPPPRPNFMPHYSYDNYGYSDYQSYPRPQFSRPRRPFGGFRSSRGKAGSSQYPCFFCNSTDHWVRDCQKLKALKEANNV